MRNLVLAFFSTLTFNSLASATVRESKLVGTWRLQEFLIISADGSEEEFCEGAHGSIIYEATGGMSVAINCDEEQSKPVPADQYGNMLFYAGTFNIAGDSVKHDVKNSNFVDFIGKQLIRKVDSLTSSHLILSGKIGDTGTTLRIEWTRRASR